VDPDVASTGEPYSFAGDDPVNGSDSTGLFFTGDDGESGGFNSARQIVENGENSSVQTAADDAALIPDFDMWSAPTKPSGHAAPGWWRDIVDIPQDGAYLTYWGSYEAIHHVNGLAEECGPVSAECSIATHIATLPLVPYETVGLGADAAANLAKGETIWQEDYNDQPLLGNEVVPSLSIHSFTISPGFNGPVVSHQLGLPGVKFPGFGYDGSIQYDW
jgi:hypothetical protein